MRQMNGSSSSSSSRMDFASPRVSFSTDFVVDNSVKIDFPSRCVEEDDMFEFSSPSSGHMIPADEAFLNGRLLPLRDHRRRMTLRDAAAGEEEEAHRPTVVPARWKDYFLGLTTKTPPPPPKLRPSASKEDPAIHVK